MEINVEDVIVNMDQYTKKYFDCINGRFVDTVDSDIVGSFIELPSVNESDIIRSYVSSSNYIFWNDIKKVTDDKQLLNIFHNRVNDMGLYDEWIVYRDGYLRTVAMDWCYFNGIRPVRL